MCLGQLAKMTKTLSQSILISVPMSLSSLVQLSIGLKSISSSKVHMRKVLGLLARSGEITPFMFCHKAHQKYGRFQHLQQLVVKWAS